MTLLTIKLVEQLTWKSLIIISLHFLYFNVLILYWTYLNSSQLPIRDLVTHFLQAIIIEIWSIQNPEKIKKWDHNIKLYTHMLGILKVPHFLLVNTDKRSSQAPQIKIDHVPAFWKWLVKLTPPVYWARVMLCIHSLIFEQKCP